MSNNETRGALQVFSPSVSEINDVFRRVRDELNELFGLSGRVLINDRVRVSDPTSRSDALAYGADAVFARLRSADGTVLLPAKSYDLDLDLGTYRIGANNEGFSAGGTLRWDYDTTRLLLSSAYRLDAGTNQLVGAIADKLNAGHLAIASQVIGDLLYADAATTFTRLAAVAANSYLRSTGVGAVPAWSILTLPNAATTGDVLYASATDTIATLADVAVGSYLRSGGVGTAPLWSTLTLPNAGTTGDLFAASATDVMGRITAVATGQVLSSQGTGTLPVWSGAPTLGTSLTTPIVYGGSAQGASLELRSSSHASPSGDVVDFFTGGVRKGRVVGGILAWGTTTTTDAADGDLLLANAKALRGLNSSGSAAKLIEMRSDNLVRVDGGGNGLMMGMALTALGGGAAATLGTIGGSGPGTAAQNSWQRLFDSTGAGFWVPVWK